MSEYTIEVKNCNNIKDAHITIDEATLNIKFGYNGTGKSTLSSAIRCKASNTSMESLKPYTDINEEESINPYVSNLPFKKVMIFNEEYINSYLFKPEGIFSDSYSVF